MMSKGRLNMNRKRIPFITLALLVLLVLLALPLTGLVRAESAGFSIGWWTVDGGGGTSTSASFTLNGTAGQPDAGSLTSANFSLAGGFWGGRPGLVLLRPLYLPVIQK
jgi:hypothetical protein